jgi:Pyruvate/2-oxoacid:ferredoxin oxidoreductase gamma subunit/quercetin dioxygenase-like cupin family protein/ribosome-binding protein aMBF1 (putative translation factor)
MRGGTANCTVVVSDREIGSPIIQRPVSSIVMNRPSLDKFGPRVRKGGLLFVNSSLVPEKEVKFKGIECIMIPTRDLAMEVGNERLTNMVMLGAAAKKSGAVKLESLKKALYPALDPRYHEMIDINTKAMERGARFIEDGMVQIPAKGPRLKKDRKFIMDEEKEQKIAKHAYEDFLADVSDHFASGDQERQFMDSISLEPSEEDIQVNVGERVREVRENRGLSIEDISQRTDIPVAVLEEIEEGSVAPPLGTVIKLAKALEMKMGYFISGKEEKPFTIVRVDDRKVISRYDSKKGKHYGYEFESLAPHKKDRHMEPFLVTLEPVDTDEERSTHDGQEFIYVLQGNMEVRLGKEVHVLKPGDSIYYDSTVPHLVKCHGDKKTKILAVLYAEK